MEKWWDMGRGMEGMDGATKNGSAINCDSRVFRGGRKWVCGRQAVRR